MKTSKQSGLSITLQSVAAIKDISQQFHPVVAFLIRGACDEITRTLILQAGETDKLKTVIHELRNQPKQQSYEPHWDSLIFAIMGTDGTADIIDAADAERITAAAIAAVKKLASDRDEKQRVAEAFQATNNSEYTLFSRRYYHNGAHAGTISYPSDINDEKLKDFIAKGHKVGEFRNMFIYSPADISLTCYGPTISESLADCITLGQASVVFKKHELKIAPEYLEAVICGQKKAETRINDRDFKVNDRLLLREWENDGYTGWEHEVVITHVCDFPYVFTGERWVSLSISPVYGLDPDAVNRYLNSRRAV